MIVENDDSQKSSFENEPKEDSVIISLEEENNFYMSQETSSFNSDQSYILELEEQERNECKDIDKMSDTQTSKESFDSLISDLVNNYRKKSNMSFQEYQQNKNEKKFHKMILKLMKYTIQKLIEKKVFKDGVEAITSKSFKDDIIYQSTQLEICLNNSKQYQEHLQKQQNIEKELIESQIKQLSTQFNLVETLKQKQNESFNIFEQQIEDQRQLQEWLIQAIQMNLGVFEINDKILIYDSMALGFISYKNSFRIKMVQISLSTWFNNLTLLIIIYGSILQALYDQGDPDDLSPKNKVIDYNLNALTFYFSFEAIIKIIAQGLYQHKNSYLKDYWNLSDFIIVLLSLLDFFITIVGASDMPSFKVLRVFRVLKPLRSIKRVPSMRKLVDILLTSLPDLVNILLFMCFSIIVFGIIGIQTFFGLTYQRCRLTEEPNDQTGLWLIDQNQKSFICQDLPYDKNNPYTCLPQTFCGSVEEFSFNNLQDSKVDTFQDAKYHWQDPLNFYNNYVYNDLGIASLIIFQSITLEGWSIQMYNLWQAGSNFSLIYYLVLIILNSYFILNLILAVIIGSFNKDHENEEKEKANKKKNLKKKLSLMNQNNENELSQQEIIEENEKIDQINIQVENLEKDFEVVFNENELQNKIENGRKSENKPKKPKGLAKIFVGMLSVNKSTKPLSKQQLDLQKRQIQSAEIIIQKNQQKNQNTQKAESSIQNLSEQNNNSPLDQSKYGPLNHSKTSLLDIKTPIKEKMRFNLTFVDKKIIQSIEQPNSIINESDESSLEQSSIKEIPILKQNQINARRKQINNSESSDLAEGGQDDQSLVTVKNNLNSCVEKFNQKICIPYSEKYQTTKFYKFFNYLSMSLALEISMNFFILLNTITLSMDKYPIDEIEYQVLEYVNQTTTFIFISEMLVKIAGFGLTTYFKENWNLFDCFVCILSLVEFVLKNQTKQQFVVEGKNQVITENPSLTFFRAFRLLRAIKLAKKLKSFNKMVTKIGQTIKDLFTFFILLFIVLFVFTLLGTQLLSNEVQIDANGNIVQPGTEGAVSPRFNFDNFSNGLILCCLIVIGDDWPQKASDAIRVYQNYFVSLYYIGLIIIGNWFLMHLFLAILLKNFQENPFADEIEKIQHEPKEELNFIEKFFSKIKTYFQAREMKQLMKQNLKIKIAEKIAEQQRQAKIEEEEKKKQQEKKKQEEEEQRSLKRKLKKFKSQANLPSQKILNLTILSQNLSPEKSITPKDEKNILKGLASNSKPKKMREKQLIEQKNKIKLEGQSLGIFSEQNRFRKVLSIVLINKFFEGFILLCVALSSILMIFDSPLQDQQSKIIIAANQVNIFVTTVFVFEFLFKIIVFGFISNGTKSYLRDGWNLLDFLIVFISLLSIIFDNLNTQGDYADYASKLELVKMLRVLRSIRIITKNEALRLSVMSLIYSMPRIMNLTIVILLFFLLFGIFFLNLFKGKFYRCIFSGGQDQFIDDNNLITMYDCYNLGGRWENTNMNFDNIQSSIFSLLVMCLNESWQDFMNSGVDGVSYGMQPKQLNNYYYQYIFIIYMMVVANLIVNLFVETVISSYDNEKNKLDKNYILTDFQKEWVQVQMKCYNLKAKPKVLTRNKMRLLSLKIIEHEVFDYFIMSIIFTNTVALCIVWVGMDQTTDNAINQIQEYCNYVFMFECLLKIFANQHWYFMSGWNLFDFLVVILGIIGMFISDVSTTFSVFRILRVARVLRMLKKLKSLNIIFNSFLHTIPAFTNVGCLIVILIYIFSIVFNRLFAMVLINGNVMNDLFNFQSFFRSFLTLIVSMTGEGWPNLMYSIGKKKSIDFDCLDSQNYEQYIQNDKKTARCGSDMNVAIAVMITFQIFVSLIMVNLFIAVTLQSFYQEQSEDSCRITDQHLNSFQEIWSNIDHDASGYIHISEAGILMRKLMEDSSEFIPKSMIGILTDEKMLQNLIQHLQLKLYRKFQFYNFHDILIQISELHLTYLVQQDPIEFQKVFHEYNIMKAQNSVLYNIEGKIAYHIEDILDQIEIISTTENVAMLKKLQSVIISYQNAIEINIDKFEGRCFNSNTIISVVRIQRAFREFRTKRIQSHQNFLRREKALFLKFSQKFRKRRYQQYLVDFIDSDDESFTDSSYEQDQIQMENQEMYNQVGRRKIVGLQLKQIESLKIANKKINLKNDQKEEKRSKSSKQNVQKNYQFNISQINFRQSIKQQEYKKMKNSLEQKEINSQNRRKTLVIYNNYNQQSIQDLQNQTLNNELLNNTLNQQQIKQRKRELNEQILELQNFEKLTEQEINDALAQYILSKKLEEEKQHQQEIIPIPQNSLISINSQNQQNEEEIDYQISESEAIEKYKQSSRVSIPGG